ncbi:MAG TPA: VWA domain-containing protein, partial [Candidatus Sulfotelmatobacter sp.]|nr:VWA domain-containing protein [Candidatus Sulfotelmatobacter sp.]
MQALRNRFLHCVLFLAVLSAGSYAQTEAAASQSADKKQEPAYRSQTVLRTTTRLVVLDVVALDDKGQPLSDLTVDDFTVLEDGKPQKIKDFSFHHPGASAQAHTPAAGIISNVPQFSSNSCLNVILLDGINTDYSNHAYAQDMLVRYLDSNPSLQPTAVFALENKLTMLHDFTTDTRALRDVVAHFKYQGPIHIPDVYAAASPFNRRGTYQVTGQGRFLTAKSMLFLAHTLAGYPGRKNLLWVSEGFPISLFPELAAGQDALIIDDYTALAAKIADELMEAQVALYPIDAAGVTVNDRFPARTAMESMAERTGGKTFYARNDIDTGIRTSLDDGSTYYTLEYSPQSRNWDGKFRRIELKLSRPHKQLRYRQGYYALSPVSSTDSASEAFSHAMDRDAPTSAAVRFQARVVMPSAQTQGKTVVNFGIDPHTIAFEKEADDLEHARLSCVVWAYGSKGEPVR